MSSQSHRDITSFFRPYARTIPQKRPSSNEGEEDTIIVFQGSNVSVKSYSQNAASKKSKTPPQGSPASKPSTSYLNRTPKRGQSISIAYRSPGSIHRESPTSSRRKPFEEVNQRPNVSFSSQTSNHLVVSPHLPSRKVVKDGVVMAIQDSDDDDDASSLASLTDIFERRGTDTPKTSPLEDSTERTKVVKVQPPKMFTFGASDPLSRRNKLRTLLAQERRTKFDFNKILNDHKKDQKAEHMIAQARADYDSSSEESPGVSTVDKQFLSKVLSCDDEADDNSTKVMTAVERTDLFATEKSFHFFKSFLNDDDWSNDKANGASLKLGESTKLLSLTQNPIAQSRSFLSGHICEQVTSTKVDEETLSCIFNQIVEVDNLDLQTAYRTCLESVSSRWTRGNLTAEDIQATFRRLGADADVLRDGHQIRCTHRKAYQLPLKLRRRLVMVLKLFTQMCNDLDFSVLSKLCSIVSRLSIDKQVMIDAQVAQQVEDLMIKLTNIPDLASQLHVHDRFILDLGINLQDAALQAKFLSHLLPVSKNTAQLRVKLATRFLLGAPYVTTKPLTTVDAFIGYLTDSEMFSDQASKNKDIDYVVMTNLVSVLDIAIADGHRPDQFCTVREEQEFNASIDRLTDRLHVIFASIEDTGASHLRRTEAKDALQMLEYRVMYSVRTKPRRKKHVFDGESGRSLSGIDYEQDMRSKNFMSKFLKRDVFYDSMD